MRNTDTGNNITKEAESMTYSILAVNPGSTSTKVAAFRGEKEIWNETIRHPAEKLALFGSVTKQFDFRLETIRHLLESHKEDCGGPFDAVVGRGGVIDPLPGGTFRVDGALIERLKLGKPWDHASNLGGVLADALASGWNAPAFIVDPVCVDEMIPEAKIMGLPELPKPSFSHALNTKATVRRAARDMNRAWDDICAIIVHLGGGVPARGKRVRQDAAEVRSVIPGLAELQSLDKGHVHTERPAGQRVDDSSASDDGVERASAVFFVGFEEMPDRLQPKIKLLRHAAEERQLLSGVSNRLVPDFLLAAKGRHLCAGGAGVDGQNGVRHRFSLLGNIVSCIRVPHYIPDIPADSPPRRATAHARGQA
jgi:hypothetical protein